MAEVELGYSRDGCWGTLSADSQRSTLIFPPTPGGTQRAAAPRCHPSLAEAGSSESGQDLAELFAVLEGPASCKLGLECAYVGGWAYITLLLLTLRPFQHLNSSQALKITLRHVPACPASQKKKEGERIKTLHFQAPRAGWFVRFIGSED